MDSKKEEKILEDLLYEHSTKKMLDGLSNTKSQYMPWILKIAAVLGVVLMAYVGSQFFTTNPTTRFAKAETAYSFPTISKSRSSQLNKVDAYIEELNEGNLNIVLSNLMSDTLSEKDRFVKANIYYTLDSLKAARTIINNSVWNDSYHAEEIAWLNFLINYREDYKLKDLRAMVNQLSKTNQIKANRLLENE